ncbi:hypothetical protein ACLOJK_022310 [Asimina triloba]
MGCCRWVTHCSIWLTDDQISPWLSLISNGSDRHLIGSGSDIFIDLKGEAKVADPVRREILRSVITDEWVGWQLVGEDGAQKLVLRRPRPSSHELQGDTIHKGPMIGVNDLSSLVAFPHKSLLEQCTLKSLLE